MNIEQIDDAIRKLQDRIRILTAERKAAVLRRRIKAKSPKSCNSRPTILATRAR